MFTKNCKWNLSSTSHNQCIPQKPIFCHPDSCLSSGLFLPGFVTKLLYAFLFYPVHVTCPAHLTILDMIMPIIFCKEYNVSYFNFLLVVISQVQIFSAPCYQSIFFNQVEDNLTHLQKQGKISSDLSSGMYCHVK
jgi:hypothetical protein